MALPLVKEGFADSPSSRDGVSRLLELRMRSHGADLLLRATILLKLPQLTGASAAAILHRFYYRRSLLEFDVRIVAPAALLLACKLQETHRSLRDVAIVFARLRLRTLLGGNSASAAGPSSDDVAQLKQDIMSVERHILRELGFVAGTLLQHPHKYVLQFVKSFKQSIDWMLTELAQTAWNYLNDSLRAPLICEFQPHEIASAGIYLAAKKLDFPLPRDPPWCTIFDTSMDVIRRIATSMATVAAAPPLKDDEVTAIMSSQSGRRTLLRRRSTGNFSPFPETPLPLPSPQSDEAADDSLLPSPLPQPLPPRTAATTTAATAPGGARSRSRSRSGSGSPASKRQRRLCPSSENLLKLGLDPARVAELVE